MPMPLTLYKSMSERRVSLFQPGETSSQLRSQPKVRRGCLIGGMYPGRPYFCSCLSNSCLEFAIAIAQECHRRAETERRLSGLYGSRHQFVMCLTAKLELYRRLQWASDLLKSHPRNCLVFCSCSVEDEETSAKGEAN
jgi:hypothetical protein